MSDDISTKPHWVILGTVVRNRTTGRADAPGVIYVATEDAPSTVRVGWLYDAETGAFKAPLGA